MDPKVRRPDVTKGRRPPAEVLGAAGPGAVVRFQVEVASVVLAQLVELRKALRAAQKLTDVVEVGGGGGGGGGFIVGHC